ncbi:endonuclease, partial [Limosilactobacillus fermentum]
MRILKRSALTLLAVITTLALVVGGYVLYMQHQYYRIPNHQKLTIGNNQAATLTTGRVYTATTYNVGFGAYNHQFSFFMDAAER